MNTLGQQEFEALFDHAAIGIITTNPAGEILMVNQFALQHFGYQREALIGQKIELLIPEPYKQVHEHHRNDYTENNRHNRPMNNGLTLSGLRKDGTVFPIEVSLSMYHTAEGRFSIAFINDITVRTASERTLLQLNAELEDKVVTRTQSLLEALGRAKDLNELKSRFVSIASHEFRTPLSTILSSAYLVSKYPAAEDHPKREKHIQRIVSSVNMLTDILNDFLSVGKIEEGKIHVRNIPVLLPEWMDIIIDELATILKKDQRLQYVHEGEPDVVLDPSLLTHIIQNLVSNAVKFSPEGSVILLITKRSGNTLELSVKDQGIGIPQEDRPHLFERFFRAGNAANIQGSGLGLHIVDKYAEMMNGTITYESHTGEGTTFTITFRIENNPTP